MKAEELMRFDWVRLVDDNTPRQVDWIRSGEVGLLWNKTVTPPYLEPIPLTPEILEKNGFEDIGDDTYQLEEKPCWFWVDFFRHNYGCEYDTSTYEHEDDEHRLKLYGIPSVHELQHALRICGIEKEIELIS